MASIIKSSKCFLISSCSLFIELSNIDACRNLLSPHEQPYVVYGKGGNVSLDIWARKWSRFAAKTV